MPAAPAFLSAIPLILRHPSGPGPASRPARPSKMSQRPASVPPQPTPATDLGYELRHTIGKGDGVYATKSFRTGETVLIGHIIAELPGNHSHATQVAADRFVQHGGLNSIVNHSCDPNCGIRLNETGANDFVARKPIGKGEELTFDYAMRNWVIEHFPEVCRCGSNLCRGSITGYRDLPEETRRRYTGFVAPYLLEME